MVSKKLLSAAIAAAMFSVPAFALDLNDSDTAIKYAKETLSDAAATVDGYFDIAVVDPITAELGFGVAETDQVWVRFDLTNAVFTADVNPLTDLEIDGTVSGGLNFTATIASGGDAEDNFVVFAVTTSADLDDEMAVDLLVSELGIKATGAVGVTYNLYELASASSGATPGTASRLATAGFSNAITVGAALSATVEDATDATADVETNFLEFTDGLVANLGTLVVDVDGDFLAADDGAAVQLADVLDSAASTVTPEGTFQFGGEDNAGVTFYFSADTAACTTQDEAVLDVDLEVVEHDLADVNGAALCVEVTGDAADGYKIAVGDYSADVDYTALNDDLSFVASSASVDFASIGRNGTVVEVPYLTTFEEYNQRLVMVNRGSAAADYSIDFTEEAGVTATGKAAATGTLAPMETKIIKAVDLVTIAGSSRTAATVTIVAAEGDIDVATTTVNLQDNATDTVVLK